jgi:hypothetical protein
MIVDRDRAQTRPRARFVDPQSVRESDLERMRADSL